ncbi:MAG: YdcH family protein [Candidatus Deferrimicrobiaceae bacterium]
MGERSQEEKITALVEKDPEFKSLVQEHRTLDGKLKEFDRKVYLSPDEEMERKRLQKLKLAKKDKIAQRLSGQ